MSVLELNRNQLYSLKQSYLTDLFYNAGLQPSYSDLADVDETISDLEIFEAFESYVFSEEDFWKEQKMKIYNVYMKNSSYYPSTFIVTMFGTIYSENAEMGFYKRDDLTVDRLNNHIEIMKKEGFAVDIVETVETADR